MSETLNLLGNLNRVASPFIKITIGNYTFGVYQKRTESKYDEEGIFKLHRITYPNYVQSLNITKINGQVNTYSLVFVYPITAGDDPNFFEKVFSSASKTRKIVFSYGDFSVPTYIYKDEVAIFTDVKADVSATKSTITYTVSAVSSAALATSGTFNFEAKYCKPSDEIKKLLRENSTYGLQDVFYGMRDYQKVISDSLIASDDKPVHLEYMPQTSIFDYLMYLVNSMIPDSLSTNSNRNDSLYTMTVIDDYSGKYGGPYFKVERVNKKLDSYGAYEVDVGYPSQNIVTDFSSEDNQTYSIFYDYNKKLSNSDYAYRVDRKGQLVEVYSPTISSDNQHFETRAVDKNWWSKVTEFPLKAKLTITGLLRPAILMTHVRLRIYFYGKKYIHSGLYIITKQQDYIGIGSNFKTVLSLTRVGGDDDGEIIQ